MSTPSSPLGSRDLSERAGVDLETTIASLEGGLGTLNPDTGVRIVAMWREALQQSDWPSAHDVAQLLGELEDALRADDLDRGVIGDLLIGLADATRVATTDANDARFTPSLDRLASLLEAAGQALGTEPLDRDTPDVADDPNAE